ncbi:MAG: phenylalanine--tRNA ligase subunit alpha [Chloroflexi bacterium]|nr:phenylalanine--tRNA ligase subunit alpha [Chloroflexota bacterium]
MVDVQVRLEALRNRAVAELRAVQDEADLERWRIAYLGRRGALAEVTRGLASAPASERPRLGQAANQAKQTLEQAFAECEQRLKVAALERALQAERVDVTLPGRPPALGRLHPVTHVMEQVVRLFERMGFQVAEGPEVETDYYNFEALNIPRDHPARDIWDTIYVRPPEILLRTHTSPVQARVMEQQQPPVRVVVPGRCYRYEALDASHEWMFYQVEGLAVDEGITMADLKGTLTAFARQMFWPEVRTRFRCDYFPFVEPGVEMSISCHACKGQGGPCAVCRGSGWLEILGAGMVHPRVLEKVGYDSERYTGFAFGMGLERIAMIKYGIEDIRLFYSNDLRFLQQFP